MVTRLDLSVFSMLNVSTLPGIPGYINHDIIDVKMLNKDKRKKTEDDSIKITHTASNIPVIIRVPTGLL